MVDSIGSDLEKRASLGREMEIQKILDVLPHRYPFLLVDRVVQMEERSLVAFKNVSHNEPFFMGHFPGHPVMPGVLQVEALAQATGIWALNQAEFDSDKQAAYLVGIERAKFRRPVVPGDKLDLKVEIISFRRQLIVAVGIASVGGEKACEAKIKAMISDR